MPAFVLTTCGTSLLKDMRKARDLPQDAVPSQQEALAYLRETDREDRNRGAEINSLFSMLGQRLTNGEASAPLYIHLLVSATPDGKWVGDVLRSYLRGRPEVAEVEVTVVEDLSDENPKRFGNHGLRMLVREAAKILKSAEEKRPDLQRVINATGGYKAEISFAGLIGQALKVPVVYLFEGFTTCIELPPLPVHFDRSLWDRHYPMFSTLSEMKQVPADDLNLESVAPSIQALLEREEIDGEEYISLTPILELMHQSFLIQSSPVPTAPPPNELTPQQRRQSLTTVEHHQVKGEEAFINSVATLPWIKRIESIQLGSHTKSRVSRARTQESSEIWVWYASGDMSKQFRLVTTGESNEHWLYCVDQIEQLL